MAWGVLVSGTLCAGLAAWACIHLFLRFIERLGMTPFVVYRVALGAVLILVFAF
ncbi:MAG: undecaprenyl-diphosphate phosphatase [Halofilum sp. (in: g-proteobacteria)]|nr:undecaprenyl-diphosphate phosphatase [Halofilum sp. (in: g-proteobacteria)]